MTDKIISPFKIEIRKQTPYEGVIVSVIEDRAHARFISRSESTALVHLRAIFKQELSYIERRMDKKELARLIGKDIDGQEYSFSQLRLTDLAKHLLAIMDEPFNRNLAYFKPVVQAFLKLISTDR